MKKLFIIFAILCLAAPAMAADWNFYGSARMWTGMNSLDKEANREANGDAVFDDDDLEWQDLGNSRFRCQCRVNDQIGGGFEIGFDGGTIYHRKVFGTYNFGGGKVPRRP